MQERKDDLAQVGIGTMIVFIGTLIAVTSSAYVMIGQLEIISQSTEQTIAVATNEAHTQIVFVGAWVDDAFDDFLFMIEYQSLGEEVETDEVGFVLWCEKDDTVHRRTGYLGDPLTSAPSRTTIWAIGEDPNDGIPDRLQSGKRYFIIADGGVGNGDTGGETGGPIDACGPKDIFENGITAYYSIYLPNGGHTTQELRVNVFEVGESVT